MAIQLILIAMFSRRKFFKIMSVLKIFNILNNQNQFELFYLYWIPKHCKNPYNQRYISGSSKCSNSFFTPYQMLTAIMKTFQEYCATVYLRSNVNQIWLLSNFKVLLENLKSKFVLTSIASKCTTFLHFIQPYPTIN